MEYAKEKSADFFFENKQKEANLNAKTDQILQTNKFCMNEKIQKNKAKEKPKLVRQWRLYTSLPIRYYSNFLSTFVVASPEIRFSFCHSARVNQSITTLFLSLSLFLFHLLINDARILARSKRIHRLMHSLYVDIRFATLSLCDSSLYDLLLYVVCVRVSSIMRLVCQPDRSIQIGKESER